MIALLGLLAAAHAAPSPFGVPTRWLDALRRAEFTSVDRQMVHASHTCSLRVDADCDGADPACATWESGALADLATAVLIGENDEDRAGGSVAMADVDGDGWDDYIVTASQHSGTGYANGAVYIVPSPVYGEVDLGTVATRIDGMPDGEVLQETIVGDANGDGFADLLVADVASAEVYLLHGPLSGATTTASAALTLNAYDELNWWSLGASLDMADLDGDGLAEVVLGVPGEGGRVLLFPGNAEGTYNRAVLMAMVAPSWWSVREASMARRRCPERCSSFRICRPARFRWMPPPPPSQEATKTAPERPSRWEMSAARACWTSSWAPSTRAPGGRTSCRWSETWRVGGPRPSPPSGSPAATPAAPAS